MENMNDGLGASGSCNEAEVLEMLQPASNMEDMDSFKSEDYNGASDRQFKLTIDDHSKLLTPESRSSTPTSGTEYKSCSNSSTPEKPKTFERKESFSSQAEATCSINMSANIASKLNQMRVSRENLDSISQSSNEEVASGEELCSHPPLGCGSRGSPPTSGRRPSKPSLRQVFPYISCLPFENNIVFCFVLSVWDNIVGPQTVYVWKRKAFPSQKTFDFFDDREGREGLQVGEDRTECKHSEKIKEGHPSIASEEECVQGQKKKQNEIKNASSHPERLLPTTQAILPSMEVKKSPNNLVKQSCIDEKQHSGSEESVYHEIGEETVFSVNVLKDQERTASQGKVSLKYGYSEDKAVMEDISKNSAPSINIGQNSDNVAEPEKQEFGSSWACGRSRLRIGKVVWYVTVHSVGVGQVGPSSEKITSSLHVVPHQGIIIVAARFTVEEEDGAVPYCLSMVVPLEEYNNFLPLTQTVTSWLVTIAATTRLLITKHGLEGGGHVKCKLVELCDVLVALRSASLDQYPLTPAGRPPDDRRFAEIILTSHLQTMGSSVVVADSPNTANKVVMWIAQFSDPATLHASRLCLSYAQWPFHPGLFIQGIVRSSNGEVNLSAQKLIQSSRPLTVIDVNRGTVKQTGAPDVHARRNSSALHQELLSLWHDLPDVSVPSESLLEPVRGAAPLVKRFLHDYDRLSSCSSEVRQNFIQAFLRSLQYTALALITWTQHEWSAQRRRSGYGSLRRALCSVFDLEELDLRVVLAQAEILEPGFYSYVTSMSQ